MLISCPECNHTVSDKALSCPNCGYPTNNIIDNLSKPIKKRTRKKHKKLPNGFGSIKKLSGTRNKPYAAYPPTTEYSINGNPVPVPAIGYYEDWYSAFDALRKYNHNPYDINKSKLTFSDVFTQFYETKFNSLSNFSATTEKVYRTAFGYAKPLHDIKFSEIKKNELQRVIDNCPLGYSSLRSIKNLFGQMFKYALENDIVDKDYSRFVVIHQENNIETGDPFSEQELQILWEHSNNEYVQIALILIYTGLRISELKIVNINIGEKYIQGGLKTKNGKNRIVPIHNKIEKFVTNFNQEKYHPGTYGDKYFKKIMNDLDMITSVNGKKHTPHDCRHTFSWLCDKYGVDDVSKHMLMGHSLGNDVEKAVYAHRTIDELRIAINKIM